MTENVPPTGSRPPEQPVEPEPAYRDRWDDRAARRAERRAARHAGEGNWPWIGGAILILLGIIFLAQNLNVLILGGNWWALLILIPAIGSFAAAWRQYQIAGAWNAAARGPLFGAVILTLIAATFFFGLDFGKIWPLFLILAGIGALLSGMGR